LDIATVSNLDSFHHDTTAFITTKVVVYAPAERAGKERNDVSRWNSRTKSWVEVSGHNLESS